MIKFKHKLQGLNLIYSKAGVFMRPKLQYERPDLFKNRLAQMINLKHPLVQLSDRLDWSVFEEQFGSTYHDTDGRPGAPIRVYVGLHYLKHSYNESDESVLYRFLENPYWQYFCGFEYFQHSLPIDPSSMTRFRKRVGWNMLEQLFKELLMTAQRSGHLTESDLNHVNVDTTVQEKAISFPTDAKLYYKMREVLIKYAKNHCIDLRQNYRRLSRQSLIMQSRYSHAKQFKRAARQTKQLKTFLGRVYRDLQRKVTEPDKRLNQLLQLAERLLKQEKHSKDKLYSIHAPEVECISKGKAHKRYEFGCKVSLATTSKQNWIVGVETLHNNPYDGNTLAGTIKKVESLTGMTIKNAYVDLGYRGHNYEGPGLVHVVDSRKMKKLTRSVRNWFKRRSAIEPVIGHLKSDNRLQKNHLKGQDGDHMNAILAACGFNMRKLLTVFLYPKLIWQNLIQKLKNLIDSNAHYILVLQL
jgi:IS5 family transposase